MAILDINGEEITPEDETLGMAKKILDDQAAAQDQILSEEQQKELVLDPKAVLIAIVVHEATRTFFKVNNMPSPHNWHETEANMQLMTIRGVLFLMEYNGAHPESLHNQWCKEMFQLGWKAGLSYDYRIKEHHCLMPYADLSDFDWKRYELFCGIVNALK